MTLEWLAPDLRRICAQNPSAMTGSGTNTYVLGRGTVVVIDPGPQIPGHLSAITAALDPHETLAAILVTHGHQDHSGLAPDLSRVTGAATHGFGPARSGRSAVMQRLSGLGLCDGGEGFDPDFTPDHLARDGDRLVFGPLEIEVLHTPGHTGCHLCFGHAGRLFSGDHVMGWSTSLVSPPDGDMADYMSSLEKLARRGWNAAFPGHGAMIADVADRIAALMAHRARRESDLLAALGPDPSDLPALTRQLYADTPAALWPAAQRNLLAHLIKLWDEGRIESDCPPGPTSRFSAKL